MSYKSKREIAKEFRKQPTSSEWKLWQIIKEKHILGYKFRRQYVVAGFIIDFYCPSLRLGIEVDGAIHYVKKNIERDLKREQIIKKYRINIIRITNQEIEADPIQVLRRLKDYIKNIQSYFL